MKKIISVVLLTAVLALSLAACGSSDKILASKTINTSEDLLQFSPINAGEEVATIKVKGIQNVIKIRFFPNQAPKAVENFITHAKEGYYNGLTFHRVMNNFMIQSGDPKGDGTGGQSIWGQPFTVESSPLLHNFRGALSMARTNDPVSNGSQFFIVQNPNNSLTQNEFNNLKNSVTSQRASLGLPALDVDTMFSQQIFDEYNKIGGTPQLDGLYTVFGQVYEGIETVDEIASRTVNKETNKPLKNVVIESITIQNYQ